MIKLILIFLLLLVSVWLGVQLQHDKGYILIAVNHWSIETTLWIGILALVVAFFLLHFSLVFFSWLASLSTSWRQWRVKRRFLFAESKTKQGLIEFSEGRWKRAAKDLIKAVPNASTPLLNYLTAARAAQEMGDSKMRDDFLLDAEQNFPEARVAVALTQAQLQIEHQQWEQALTTLQHLRQLSPHHSYVIKLLSDVYQKVNAWDKLILLMPELKRLKAIQTDTLGQLEQETYLQLLHEKIKENDAIATQSYFDALPKHLKQSAIFLEVFCRYIKHQDCTQAENLVRQFLRREYSDSLVLLYGEIASIETASTQGKFIESLLKKYPDAASLHYCLGELYQIQHQWVKAKNCYEESIQLKPTPMVYAKIGALLEELGDHANAFAAYRKGLQLYCDMQN